MMRGSSCDPSTTVLLKAEQSHLSGMFFPKANHAGISLFQQIPKFARQQQPAGLSTSLHLTDWGLLANIHPDEDSQGCLGFCEHKDVGSLKAIGNNQSSPEFPSWAHIATPWAEWGWSLSQHWGTVPNALQSAPRIGITVQLEFDKPASVQIPSSFSLPFVYLFYVSPVCCFRITYFSRRRSC